MNLGRLVACSIVYFAAAVGCANHHENSKDRSLTNLATEQARSALKAMAANSNDIALINSLEYLRLDEKVDGSRVEFGPWRCDLQDKTFVLTIDAPPYFTEYSGVFELKAGLAIARVEEVVRN